MVVTVVRQSLQVSGVLTITAEEIRKHSPARDVSELIRMQPRVNLIGSSASGQRDSDRQTDIRGMGSENTLVLIDGKPTISRNSVRYGWRGGRDFRSNTNWVPAEAIDHTDMIRGPAAARYGNGAMDGVINIVTKPTTSERHGSWNTYMNALQHRKEGMTKRINFSLNGPPSDGISFSP